MTSGMNFVPDPVRRLPGFKLACQQYWKLAYKAPVRFCYTSKLLVEIVDLNFRAFWRFFRFGRLNFRAALKGFAIRVSARFRNVLVFQIF